MYSRCSFKAARSRANVLVLGLMASCVLEYLATGVAYWNDRRSA